MTRWNVLNSESRLPFSDERFLTWCRSMCFASRSCALSVCSVFSASDLHLSSRLSNIADRRFSIWSSSSNCSISCRVAANSLLGPTWKGSVPSRSLTLAAKLSLRSQILANFLACSTLSERLASMTSNWTSSVALIQLIAWSGKCPGLPSMTFIWFVTYSVERSSVLWKPVVAEVLNLLLNLIDSALSFLSVKLTSYVSCRACVSCVPWVARRATKSEDWGDACERPAVHWFEDKPSQSAIVCCVSIASDAGDAVRS